ncbi:MAG TPA: DUF58 domain-containing protein [Acidimicrobiales bacterium]|nr:DUF58 domain-containing protein [Acidimicrobiales bacterium]
MHPVRSFGPFAVTTAVLLGWGFVAHDSGSGWVQVLGEFVGAVVVVGLFGPAVALARTELECRANPGDDTAGSPVELAVTASQRVRVQGINPPGPVGFVGPRRFPDAPSAVVIVPARHGVVESVILEVASAAPFGLLWWSRRVVVALPSPLHVAPRLGTPLPVTAVAEDGIGDASRRAPAVIGEARGARPYRPGDSRQWVHWPSTAHTGALMVREMEGPMAVPATVTVSLPADPEAAEAVAQDALATVLALVSKGTPVTLVTTERSGSVSGPVEDRRSAGRRLARAVAPAGTGGDLGGVSVVVEGRDRPGRRS